MEAEQLPILKMRSAVVAALQENQTLVLQGETGSGKSTQLPQFLLDPCLQLDRIAVSQPRRVAARALAARVAAERGARLGEEVGYTVRFENCSRPDTRIKFLTDGLLVREAMWNPGLPAYSAIILDEAHERTVSTDLLLGLLKRAAAARPELKLVITSATMKSTQFAEFFSDAAVLSVPGRAFPVAVVHCGPPCGGDVVAAAVERVMVIHRQQPPGDILLFLPGQEEIELACEKVEELQAGQDPHLEVLPLYGALDATEQSKIFCVSPTGERRLVVATNIAETSITVPGLRYVVDPGTAKKAEFDARSGTERLEVRQISQAEAEQRAGRAGRTGPGTCYRLYSQQTFDKMHPSPALQIQQSCLAAATLQLAVLGAEGPELAAWPWLDSPPPAHLARAAAHLTALSLFDKTSRLTALGRLVAQFPLQPRLARAVVLAARLGCSQEMLVVAAMLSEQPLTFRPRCNAQRAETDKWRRELAGSGDFTTLLNTFHRWQESEDPGTWCQQHCVHVKAISAAAEVAEQLRDILQQCGLAVASCGANTRLLREAICGGLVSNAARLTEGHRYHTLSGGAEVFIHPGSVMAGKQPNLVVYMELVEGRARVGKKKYMRGVTSVEQEWLNKYKPSQSSADGECKKDSANLVVQIRRQLQSPPEVSVAPSPPVGRPGRTRM